MDALPLALLLIVIFCALLAVLLPLGRARARAARYRAAQRRRRDRQAVANVRRLLELLGPDQAWRIVAALLVATQAGLPIAGAVLVLMQLRRQAEAGRPI